MSERLPTERVFLLRLSSNSEPPKESYCGRIEHVQTGRVARFSSLADTERFIAEMLTAVEKE